APAGGGNRALRQGRHSRCPVQARHAADRPEGLRAPIRQSRRPGGGRHAQRRISQPDQVTPDNNGPVITLTTDFGYGSPYVAAMKGVILSINPAARILDLSHAIPPQALRHAAFFLASAVPYFPPQAIHAVVVDPGVGTDRALLYVETGQHRLLVPDNGCWTELLHISGGEPLVHQITESRYWRATVSSTFHGRDILAPVAAHLSRGLDPRALGSRASKWVRLDLPRPWRGEDGLHGEVIFVDHFGNLITNIGGE